MRNEQVQDNSVSPVCLVPRSQTELSNLGNIPITQLKLA